MSIFEPAYQNYVNENYDEPDELVCVCGHTEEEHYYDGDSTAKFNCEQANNDGSSCSCDDFKLPGEENYE